MTKVTLKKIVEEVWELFEKQVENLSLSPKDLEWAIEFVPNQLLKLGDGMLGTWNSMAKGGWATLGPRMLGPTFEKGTVTKVGKRTFLAPAPMGSRTAIVIEKLDGKAGAEVEICVHGRNGDVKQKKTLRFPTDSSTRQHRVEIGKGKGGVVSVTIDAKMPALRVDKFEYRIRYQERPIMSEDRPVEGIADLHVHQVAEYAYMGNWIHGSHAGPAERALRPCSSAEHAVPEELWNGIISTAPAKSKVFHGAGHPTYADWPHHLDMGHQQAHEGWLKEAHEGGLNLIIACPVNNEPFSLLMGAIHPREAKGPFRDMPVIKEQIKRIHAFAKQHSWYQIALNPWHAREIIHAGNMAVVISAECSNLFPVDQGDYIEQLDELYSLDVRCLQIVHEVDSRFAGAAPQEKMLSVLQTFKQWLKGDLGLGFKLDAEGKNTVGLTPAGEKLLHAMMDRHMLIDTAHYSTRALESAYQIAMQRRRYPLISSHTKFNSVISPEEQGVQREFVTTDAQIRIFRDTGGILGLRTAPWPNRQAPRGRLPIAVATDEGDVGTARSYAQQVTFAHDHGVAFAIGSDFNGFTNQLGPPDPNRTRPRGVSTDYWKNGLRHIGRLPDLVRDLESLNTPGADLLASSAETFLQCWERAWIRPPSNSPPAPSRQPVTESATKATVTLRTPRATTTARPKRK